MTKQPAIQLISNLVVSNEDGEVLLVRYDPAGEPEVPDADARWWLPGAELEPYSHPDDAAADALAEIDGLSVTATRLTGVESFRGRRGWHVSFEYDVRAAGDPTASSGVPAAWHALENLPRTVHGKWERSVIERVRASANH